MGAAHLLVPVAISAEALSHELGALGWRGRVAGAECGVRSKCCD
jgi:hypothetical protein